MRRRHHENMRSRQPEAPHASASRLLHELAGAIAELGREDVGSLSCLALAHHLVELHRLREVLQTELAGLFSELGPAKAGPSGAAGQQQLDQLPVGPPTVAVVSGGNIDRK